jgi:sulfoxide reductase heme-binding subunit YedZ
MPASSKIGKRANLLGITAPWRDQAGRLSALKIVILLLVIWPGALLTFRWWAGDLGGRPVTAMIDGIGEWTVRFLLLTLAVTPARAVLDWPKVLQLRRMLGVTTACYATAHLVLFCVDQKWHLFTVASEIVLRFYLTIGFVTLLGLLALGITSTDGWQKHLGARWKKLHLLIFPLTVLALFHYALQSKADVSDAILAAGFFAWLGYWRLVPRRFQARLWLLPLLTIAASLTTAVVEAGWYFLATGAKAQRVLLANLNIAFGPRPAVVILLAGFVLLIAATLRRVKRRRPAGPLAA